MSEYLHSYKVQFTGTGQEMNIFQRAYKVKYTLSICALVVIKLFGALIFKKIKYQVFT
jgi:hypothetical protein